jgi:hypothetical protein
METPEHLYHYTSQEVLLGILKTNKLWMSNNLYLNDGNEYDFTDDIG